MWKEEEAHFSHFLFFFLSDFSSLKFVEAEIKKNSRKGEKEKMEFEGESEYEKEAKVKFRKYLENAEKGDDVSQLVVSFMYSTGEGVQQNKQESDRWLFLSAENGNKVALARRSLGESFPKHAYKSLVDNNKKRREEMREEEKDISDFTKASLIASGMVYSRSPSKAVQVLRELGEKGFLKAKYNLAVCYEKGVSVEKDLVRANSLYSELAKKGFVDAIFALANNYFSGNGLEKDEQKANSIYKHLAEKGCSSAIYTLACNVYHGIGHAKDVKRAYELFQLASNNGDTASSMNLGQGYEMGEGVEIDLDKAALYYHKAFKQGEKSARVKLCSLLDRVNWNKEYHHLFFSKREAQAQVEKNINEKIVSLLLVSKFRRDSKYQSVKFLVNGIAFIVIKFLCNLTQREVDMLERMKKGKRKDPTEDEEDDLQQNNSENREQETYKEGGNKK